LYQQTELLEQIMGLLGGRVAEEVVFKEITTGAHNDFSKATKIARSMVTEYGMSSLGPVQLETREGSSFLGRDYNKNRNFSDQVALEIDNEVRKIINECYEKAKSIIEKNRDLLDLIASSLIEHETLTKEQIDYLAANGKMPEEDMLDDLSTAKLKELAKEKKIKNYSSMNKDELKKALSEEVKEEKNDK
jgi:cell division protease FtsH